MVQCENCGRTQKGQALTFCPNCGYIMKPLIEERFTEEKKLDEENIEDGRDL